MELSQDAHVSLSNEFSQLNLNNAMTETVDVDETRGPSTSTGATSKARGGITKQQMPMLPASGAPPRSKGPLFPKVAIAEQQPMLSHRKRPREESSA